MSLTYFDIDFYGKRVKFSCIDNPETFTGYCLATYSWGERVMLTTHVVTNISYFTLSDANGFFRL